MAKQGFNFNSQYNGNPYDADVYSGLYAALNEFSDPITQGLSGHNKEVYSIEASPIEDAIFTGGTKGRILKWTFDEETVQSEVIVSSRGPSTAEINDMAISPNGSWLVVAGKFGDKDNTYLEVYNLGNKEVRNIDGIRDHSAAVTLSPDNQTIYYIDNDGKAIGKVGLNGNNQSIIHTSPTEMKDIDLSHDGSVIASIGTNAKVVLLKTNGDLVKEIQEGFGLESVKYSPDGKYLAVGDDSGNIYLYSTSDYNRIKVFTDHEGSVEDLDFNLINGKSTFMASASLDRTIKFFNLEKLNDPPITNTNSFKMFSAEFTLDNERIFAGGERKILKLYPIHPETMADKMCGYLTRQMTDVEWEAFVGTAIPKENTCETISSSSN